jgi:hypothetical protein
MSKIQDLYYVSRVIPRAESGVLTELSNEIPISRTALFSFLQELARPTSRYRTQIPSQFIFTHSNTSIYRLLSAKNSVTQGRDRGLTLDNEFAGTSSFIKPNFDSNVRVSRLHYISIHQAGQAEFLKSIVCVGKEFSEEDVFVGVKTVDDQGA